MNNWTVQNMNSQFGRTALVTGGAIGVGLEVAKELARSGARVIICASDAEQGLKALAEIRSAVDQAYVVYEQVNFADLNSVKYLCEKIKVEYDEIHLLINNLDIRPTHKRLKSAQGHELVFAENYLAHFAITAQLFPLISLAHDGRIIFQSAVEHETGVLDFFDLDSTLFYDPKKVYSQSKLAVHIFARELDRRIRLSNLDIKSIPVHIGGAHTPVLAKLIRYAFGQSPEQAALSTLYAATSFEAQSGHYYGPDSLTGKGSPQESDSAEQAKSIYIAERLWDLSEKMTGIEFTLRDMSNVLPFQMRGNIHPENFI